MVDKVSEVFRSTGQPTVTYVQRDNGSLEKRLHGYLDEAGQICLVTGPSKTGKTTLYKQVLASRDELPLVVQCTKDKSAADIWKEALEKVSFERDSSSTSVFKKSANATVEAAGEGGWQWLAKVTGKLQLTKMNGSDESTIRQRVLAEPHPDLLIPILQSTRYVLVIEDFHYLEDDEKKGLFQQWKRFIDSEITIIVLGTSHRAVDIANSNKDLVGRIGQIDVRQWAVEDLQKICELGFKYLNSAASQGAIKLIAQESVGLPILAQQICLEMFNLRSINTVRDAKRRAVRIDIADAKAAFFEVAHNRYTQFASYYDTLIRGPREGARVYRTYELVLACFTVDPILFNLSRNEIDRRLAKLLTEDEARPPAASVNSTLGALKKFQETRKFQLLEWMPVSGMLYIVEPAFLFYVRWRNKRGGSEQLDLFEELLGGMN